MSELLNRLADTVECGKANRESPYPEDLIGQDGAAELCRKALDSGIAPDEILKSGLVVGMRRIGDAFGEGRVFIPQILIAARAMNAAMEHLKPLFEAGDIKRAGTVILGTVAGDLHDIGKRIVQMVLEGDGWEVIDLGVDVESAQFVQALESSPRAIIAMSALLTTTMPNMSKTLDAVKASSPDTKVFVGGAPVTKEFAEKIGADSYFPDPHSFARYLASSQTLHS